MRTKFRSLFAFALIICMTTGSFAGCGSIDALETEISLTEYEDLDLTIEEDINIESEIKTIEPPEDGWTLELLNQVVYFNNKPLHYYTTLGEFKELLGEDFTIGEFKYGNRAVAHGYFREEGRLFGIGINCSSLDEVSDDSIISDYSFYEPEDFKPDFHIDTLFNINGLRIGEDYDKMITVLGNNFEKLEDIGVYRYWFRDTQIISITVYIGANEKDKINRINIKWEE